MTKRAKKDDLADLINTADWDDLPSLDDLADFVGAADWDELALQTIESMGAAMVDLDALHSSVEVHPAPEEKQP